MKFEVLRSAGEEGSRWASLVNDLRSPDRDIHFLPQYGELYHRTYGHEPFLAFYGDDEQYIIQPFVKRRLNDLPFLRDQGITEPYFDIANPYGYGGPIGRSGSLEDARQLFRHFNEEFTGYCERQDIASEFTSLHPFLKNHEIVSRSDQIEVIERKEVVYIDLAQSEDDIWKGLNRGHRSSINKAKKNGVTVEKVLPGPEPFALFNRLYYRTMERNLAADRWFFPEAYFRNCYEVLGPDRISLFFARVKGEVASAYLLMHDFSTAYYHFGGSDDRFYDLRPNNLLMFETALWAKRVGFRHYHLGGGVSSTADDSLLRYKAGFSDRRAKLYTYGRVHNRSVYARLCEWKIRHERSAGQINDSDYFPLYRR